VAANALDLARQGHPKSPFYMTGQVSGQSFSVHSQGERLVLTRDGQTPEEIALTDPPQKESASAATPICPHVASSPTTNELDPEEPHAPEQPLVDGDDEATEEGTSS
jgi:hypothetical protein